MPRAVRLDGYGPVEVLYVADVPRPTAGDGEVVVAVVTAGIGPGEIEIREGGLQDVFPTTFPSGQGNDLAGRVVEVGANVAGFAVGDEVIGYSDRRDAQADFVAVPASHVVIKPDGVGWNEAGALYGSGVTGYATVRAVAPTPADTVAISGAAGGVGSIASQLAVRTGARVIGIAGPRNAEWLTSVGVQAVPHGDGLADRLRAAAPNGIDAFIDTFGRGYVKLAVDLGVTPRRIDTTIDFPAAQKYRVKTDASNVASNPTVLGELAALVAAGKLTIPIANTYPLEQVREAYTELAERHTHGNIVLGLTDHS